MDGLKFFSDFFAEIYHFLFDPATTTLKFLKPPLFLFFSEIFSKNVIHQLLRSIRAPAKERHLLKNHDLLISVP